jgi:NAD(P)-dependent dehydrogenase (short-subunit alcohol dehydrogenase family)
MGRQLRGYGLAADRPFFPPDHGVVRRDTDESDRDFCTRPVQREACHRPERGFERQRRGSNDSVRVLSQLRNRASDQFTLHRSRADDRRVSVNSHEAAQKRQSRFPCVFHVSRRAVGDDDDRRAGGCGDRICGSYASSEPVDRRRLEDIERFAARDRSFIVDETDFVDPVANRKRVSNRCAERSTPENGDNGQAFLLLCSLPSTIRVICVIRVPYSNGMNRMDLDGRSAVVTGGSRGIGFAIAAALVAGGSRVAIAGRSQAQLDTAANRLKSQATGKGDVIAISADVGRASDSVRLIDSAVQRFGGLDILINNAGIGAFANVADMSVEEWDAVIQTNLSGAFYCSHAAIPHLKKQGGGWIINISSLAGKNPFVGGGAYCASKAALNAFSEALMQEVRYDNIRVSYIMPGSVSTGFSGRGDSGQADWKIAPEDIGELVVELITYPSRSLPSRIELRPSRPKKGQ